MVKVDYIEPSKELKEREFRYPPMRFSPIPFWFWNADMNEEKMEWELGELKDKGIESFFIHGRYGLNVPYLSEEWFRKVQYVIGKAKEKGLKVWVYDEYNWPSGTAGLQVTKSFPETREKILEAVIWRFRGPIFVFPSLGDSRYMDLKDVRLLRAIAVPTKDLGKLPEGAIDLTSKLSFGEAVSWESPEEDMTFMMFLEKQLDWYIDPFDDEPVDRFIELTHEKYFKAVGEDFGSNVLGFYTDEPAYYYYRTGTDLPAIPWSPKFPELFLKQKGYDLMDHLPALFFDIGEKTTRIRCDFWDFVTNLYAEKFYRKLADWCHEHGVAFTGHLLFEDDLRRHVRCEGNVFEHLRHLDIVGVDHLYPRIGTRDSPEDHIAPKIASSAAHHYGSPRALCETFGGIYWDATFERMKWITDWEYVLGIDMLNPHGFHYSIEGDRKRDWPPSQFYHHPFWKHYRGFAEYVARLTYALSGGRHVADVLLLFPIVSAWAEYVPQERTFFFDLVERDFSYLTDALLRIHRDYDYVDEKVLQGAEVTGKEVRIGDESYPVLLMSPMTTIRAATMKRIREFYEKGGKILATTLLPFKSAEEGKDEQVIRDVESVFGISPLKVKDGLRRPKGKPRARVVRSSNSRGGQARFISVSAPLNSTRPRELIERTLSELVEEDVRIDDEDVMCLHKRKGDADLYFVTNLSDQDRGLTLDMRGEVSPEIWSPENGEAEPAHVYTTERGRTRLPLYLPRHNSTFVVAKHGAERTHVKDTNVDIVGIEETGAGQINLTAYSTKPCRGRATISRRDKTTKCSLGTFAAPRVVDLPGRWKTALEGDNALLLQRWRVGTDEDESGTEKGWHEPSFNDGEWSEVACGPLSAHFGKLPKRVWYRSRFAAEGGEVTKMLLDGLAGRSFTIFINGEAIDSHGPRSSLDVNIVEVDIRGRIVRGENTVAIVIEPSSLADGLLDPLRLLGRFEVQEDGGQALVTSLRGEMLTGKSWTEQGLPYLSGTVVYDSEVDLPASLTDRMILLDCGDVGDDLEVAVDGEYVSTKLWHPYVVDVTGRLRPGRNKITIKVTNTATNLITGKKRPSGLLTVPRLRAYDLHRTTISPTRRQ